MDPQQYVNTSSSLLSDVSGKKQQAKPENEPKEVEFSIF